MPTPALLWATPYFVVSCPSCDVYPSHIGLEFVLQVHPDITHPLLFDCAFATDAGEARDTSTEPAMAFLRSGGIGDRYSTYRVSVDVPPGASLSVFLTETTLNLQMSASLPGQSIDSARLAAFSWTDVSGA